MNNDEINKPALGLCFQGPKYAQLSFKPWSVYPVNRIPHNIQNGSHACYLEDASTQPRLLSSLSAEFYNFELQKVDTTDYESVLEFVNKYGIPLRPRENAKAGFLVSRYSPSYLRDNGFIRKEGQLSRPKTYSEYFRQLYTEREDDSVGGIIAEDEVIETLRSLQTATALACAYDAISQSTQDTGAFLEYLSNPEFVQQNGTDAYLSFGCQSEFVGPSARTALNGRRMRPLNMDDIDRAVDIYLHAGSQSPRDTRRKSAQQLMMRDMEFGIYHQMQHATAYLESFLSPDVPDLRREYRRRDQQRPLLELDERVYTEGSISEAVCKQFLYTYHREDPWRICENCGRFFKFSKEADLSKQTRSPRFCRRSCSLAWRRKR